MVSVPDDRLVSLSMSETDCNIESKNSTENEYSIKSKEQIDESLIKNTEDDLPTGQQTLLEEVFTSDYNVTDEGKIYLLFNTLKYINLIVKW